MPVDPWIARGGVAFDATPAMNSIIEDRRRAQTNALLERRTALDERQFGAEQAAARQSQQDAAEKEEMGIVYQAAKAGNLRAFDYAAQKLEEHAPGAFSGLPPEQRNGAILKVLEQSLGITPEKVPGPIQHQRVGGADFWTQDGKSVLSQAPQRAPVQAPANWQIIQQRLPNGMVQDYEWNPRTRERNPVGAPYMEQSASSAKDAAKAAAEQVKAEARAASRASDAQNVLGSISDAEDLVGFFSTGLVGQVLGNIGGTDAYDLQRAVDTVKANVGFDRLQRMREESKTGGALGQVAIQELQMLQAVIDSLDPAQSPEQLRKALSRVREQYQRAIDAYEKAQQGKSAANPATAGLPSLEQRLNGYYTGG